MNGENNYLLIAKIYMKKNTFVKYSIMFLFIGFFPSFAFASNIYFETSRTNVSVGDTFIVSVKIDAGGTSLNTVEGDIVLESDKDVVTVNDFSLAKSVFSLWPKTPVISSDGTISFVGGVPGGFKLDKAILFNIIVEANKEGSIKIIPKNMAVYANDGKATRVSSELSSLTINVSPKNESNAPLNEWGSLVSTDKINPEEFAIIIGKDASLFEGKRFAFFTAVDNQSGISYYEVSENGKAPIRSGSTYVLENQDLRIDPILTVTAYDKAGNKTVSVYKNPGISVFGFSINFFIIIILIIIISVVIRKIKKNGKEK